MASSLDIPGFYRDPTTGRYYRLKENDCTSSGSNTFSDGQRNIIANHAKDIVRKPRSLTKLFINRAEGLVPSSTFPSEFLNLKVKKVEECELQRMSNYKLHNIRYLKGGAKTLYGVWDNDDSYWIGELPHRLTPADCATFRFIPSEFNIIDLCELYKTQKCLITVSNNYIAGHGTVQRVDIYNEPEVSLLTYTFGIPPVYSCCSNNFTEKFVVGTEIGFSVYDISRHLWNLNLRGRAHSVEYNQNGNLLYTGLHTGCLLTTDLRIRQNVAKIHLDCFGLNGTKLMSNEHHIIVSGFRGMLRKIDLRMRRKVCEFHDNVQTPQKIPFTISESHDLLCATGSDNITRLWPLSGGKPLYTLEPKLKSSKKCRSWMLSDELEHYIYMLESHVMSIYQI